ncbi:gluconolaconase [Acuticoccus sediminis]|uniref:Gluconolaconase n=1 Tax=Acuticoccus sediminis TaxID=2184697 RepID=A0A8B2NYN3_9HYPH|nr:SMP-30/gluconolactonase/LRE family protein [Acuticoccus sediminis]RAI02462.1 gluconolaconase [Acuticoccus sediminis]
MNGEIHRIGTTVDGLGESPVWDDAAQALVWVDALAGTVRRLDPRSGALEAFALPAPIGSVVLARDGTLVAALKDSLARLDPVTGEVRHVADIGIGHPDVRLNDGKVDRTGAFVFGSMHSHRADGEAPEGGLYRLAVDGTVERIGDPLGVANGPAFALDGRTLYIADSPRRVIWQFDYAGEGPLTNRQVFADLSPLSSGGDGATIDAAGFLWTALVRVGKIARFAPDGRLDRLIDLPVTHPTSLTFGGADLDVLYVTSISRSTGLSASEPWAGALLAVTGLGVRGLPADRYAGA